MRSEKQPSGQYVDPSSLREAVNSIRESRRIGRVVSVPRSNEAPERVTVTATAFKRLAGIVEAALFRASGLCEACGSAPFADERGNTFLEVHHIRTLAEGGPDCVENVVALCPNCHRALHYAADKDVRKDLLFERVPGIVRY
jgi:5-methylcytosine-specific restriction protein A